MSRRKEPAIPADLLDQLLAGTDAATALDQGGLLDSLKKALAERALNAEMDHHLGGEAEAGNNRNGYGRKTVITDRGKIEIDVPRDRAGSFDPQLIAKYQRRFPGFDDKIVSMYARGCCSFRPTVPTSIRSNRSSPSSRPTCERPRPGPSKHCGKRSDQSANSTHPRNAGTTSKQQAMLQIKRSTR